MHRGEWSSSFGFIMAMTGSAIGLGNIWRFPYLVDQYGGGAFLISYLFCLIFFGYFILLAMLALGRSCQSNIADGCVSIAKRGRCPAPFFFGRSISSLALLNAVLMNATYVIVTGWVLFYCFEAVTYFSSSSITRIDNSMFGHLMTSFDKQFFWLLSSIVVAGYVLMKGVNKGIEKLSTVFIPTLFLLLFVMLIWVVLQPHALESIRFLFLPDWSAAGFEETGFNVVKFFDFVQVVLGQMVYSLSIGFGVAYIYGSYVPRNVNLVSAARYIVFFDTIVSLLATIIVLGAASIFNMPSDMGSTLTFVTLPLVFSQMPGGSILLLLFFLVLFIAALTSLIAQYEPIVNVLVEKFGCSRTVGICFTAILNVICSIFVLLSFTSVLNLTIGGKDLFVFTDSFTGSFTLIISILATSIFIGWYGFDVVRQHVQLGCEKRISPKFTFYFKVLLSYIIPILLCLIFFKSFLKVF